jgi:hypothetical protein
MSTFLDPDWRSDVRPAQSAIDGLLAAHRQKRMREYDDLRIEGTVEAERREILRKL